MDDLYAFWYYDVCPYILWGKIDSFTNHGDVRIESYGGSAFKPIAILPGRFGLEAGAEINTLRAEYRRKLDALIEEYRQEALLAIGVVSDD